MPTSIEATTKGWMPGAIPQAVPASNFSIGHRDRKAVCLHLTEGIAAGALSRFQNPTQQVSSHFLVLKTGTIWQFVSVLDTAYANGLSWSASPKCWIDPEGHKLLPPHQPTWTGLQAPINPNFTTVSIERELLSTSEIPTIRQDAAVVRVLQYVQSQFPTAIPSYVPLISLIGHCHISPIARANCPGPKCDYAAFAAAANAPAMPLPIVQSYRVLGTPIFQKQNLTGAIVGYLQPGEIVEVDMAYDNGAFHLKDQRGFAALSNVQGPL